MGDIEAAAGISIATRSRDGRRRSIDQASNLTQAEALDVTELDGRTLFNAEFVIGHRDNPVLERSGVALSFRGRHSYIKFSEPLAIPPLS